VVALTRDHKLAYEEERERMMRTGVDVNEGQTRIGGGIAITRALGDHFAKDNESGMIAVPYISEAIKLTPDDTHIILASDGVRASTLPSPLSFESNQHHHHT
jgi:serine/threonine protein phosphatase PrpC